MIESEELRYHQADHERIADLEFKVIFCQVVIAALAALLVVSVVF